MTLLNLTRTTWCGQQQAINCTCNFEFNSVKYISFLSKELCIEGKKTTKVCERTVIPHKSTCIAFFNFGQFLHGIAGMPFYLLAFSFIFDHVPTCSSGLYLGKFFF